MNKRDIILDFTSLLDVIMVILFFFILFSHIETESAKNALQEAQKKADSITIEANRKLEDANDKMAEAEEKLKEADLAGERQGQNVEGLTEFNQNINIRIKLKTEQKTNNWLLEIYQGDERISRITNTNEETMAGELSAVISELGHSEDDTLLCEFIYDASEPGTNFAYNMVNEMFNHLKKDYGHFFYTEIDLSVYE